MKRRRTIHAINNLTAGLLLTQHLRNTKTTQTLGCYIWPRSCKTTQTLGFYIWPRSWVTQKLLKHPQKWPKRLNPWVEGWQLTEIMCLVVWWTSKRKTCFKSLDDGPMHSYHFLSKNSGSLCNQPVRPNLILWFFSYFFYLYLFIIIIKNSF